MDQWVKFLTLAMGVALISSGAVLMVRSRRSTVKDVAHVKLFGLFDIQTKSAGSLIFCVGAAIFLLGVVWLPREQNVPPSKTETVNVNSTGGGSIAIGRIEGGTVTINSNHAKPSPSK